MTRVKSQEIRRLYTAAEARELDRLAIEERAIPGILLMKRAGRAAFQLIEQSWPGTRTIELFCGGGNNGGDGYILAGLAAAAGIATQVWELAEKPDIKGDAARARDFALESGAKLCSIRDYRPGESTQLVVDAVLGIGFKGALRDSAGEAIGLINQRSCPVLALDVPSGLEADTGAVPDRAVEADVTLTFIVAKRGLFTGQARRYVGRLELDDLELEDIQLPQSGPGVELLGSAELTPLRALRSRVAHKGNFGTLLVIGGDYGFGGAAIMAAETALNCGAGRVILGTRREHICPALARCPEVMVHTLEHPGEIAELCRGATALVIGPGLGQSAWGQQLLYSALQSELPKVLDADALNLLAEHEGWRAHLDGKCILTPHPGEAGRMLKAAASEIERDRFQAAQRLQRDFSSLVILKGAGSLVVGKDGAFSLCPFGNPGMASAGMGDVLSGLLGALLARGFAPDYAVRAGVVAHALAADQCTAAAGETGLRATDLIASIRRLLNGAIDDGRSSV